MPSWKALTAQNRADLVAFIKTFSARWVTEKPGDPIQVPAEPKLTVESIKHGGELFQKLECWKCHGQEGRGDGPSASTLTDSNDQPIRPYNFTSDNRSKCGRTNADLYKIFMTGLDGTPDAFLRGCSETGRSVGSGALPAYIAIQQQEPRAHAVAEHAGRQGHR